MALHESVAFVMAQMTLEGQRAAESDVQLKADLAKQRHETGRITMQVNMVVGGGGDGGRVVLVTGFVLGVTFPTVFRVSRPLS